MTASCNRGWAIPACQQNAGLRGNSAHLARPSHLQALRPGPAEVANCLSQALLLGPTQLRLQTCAASQLGRRKRLSLHSQLGEKKKKEEEADGAQKEADGAQEAAGGAQEAPQSTRQATGRRHWRMLQKGFRHAVEKMKNEEMKVAYLSHGLQHLCRVAFASPVRHVAHDSLRRIFVVLDSANLLHFLKEDGTYRSCKRAPAPMAGLLHATEVDRFVAWDKGGLQVLDSDFQPLSQVQSTVPIRCGRYSEQLNRIVTVGEGNLTLWDFRYGFRSLHCLITVSQGLVPSDAFRHLVLGGGSAGSQRCFAACDTGAAAFDVSKGKLLSFKKELHSRVITDITYCEAIGCAVTASRDTTIKVWDKDWNIQTVFVGHTAPVIAVTIYPQRPLIFSASQDGTIRTWNLDTIDQVDQVHISEPVEALETKTASHVVSISGSSLNVWKINQLYSLHTLLGSPVKRLSCFNLKAVGDFPIRILCACQDSTVRLLDAESGQAHAALLLELPCQARDVAYCLPRETLFVLTEHGALLRANAAADPMVVKKHTPAGSWDSRPCCLLLYSHTVDPKGAYSTWLQVTENKGHRKPWQKVPLKMQDKNRYLLFLGHQNGSLSAVEWFSGRIQYTVEAHGTKPVTVLAEYPTQTCVISAGADLTVKLWRLFPYAEECLVPLLCFSCASPVSHLCSLGETLAVAFQDPDTVTYSIVYYNLMTQTRAEHGPEDDAQDGITGLCCCPNLKLFASASRDGSVKVWDIKNKLLRHLKLNTIPESLAFANHWGDLLVGIERHLYLIHHSKYLPSYYKMKLLCEKFLEPLKDVPLPISDSCFEDLVRENIRRLKQEPPLEETESPLPASRQMDLQESRVIGGIPGKLIKNHQDLQLLQKGKISAAKKLRVTKDMKEEAFEQYLRIFYKKQPKVEIPEEDIFNADEVLEAIRKVDSISELYGPNQCNMFLGCFRQPSVLKDVGQTLVDASAPAKVSLSAPSTVTPSVWFKVPSETRAPSGIRAALSQAGALQEEQAQEQAPIERKQLPLPSPIPSMDMAQSSVASAPDEAQEEPQDGAQRGPLQWRAVSLGIPVAIREPMERKTRMRRMKVAKVPGMAKGAETELPLLPPSQASPTSSFTGDFVKGEKSTASAELPSVRGSRESDRQIDSPSRLRSKASSVVIKDSSKIERQRLIKEWLRSKMDLENQSLPLPRTSSGFIPNSVLAQEFYSQEELLKEERIMRVIGPQERQSCLSTPAAGEHSGPSSLLSPLFQSLPEVFLTQLDESQYPELERKPPSFILPFSGTEWYKKLFPEGFPPEMSLSGFVAKLLSAMLLADFGTKVEILDAIMTLQNKLEDGMKAMVHDTLIYTLNKRGEVPSILQRDQRKFILFALRALLRINKDSKELIVELMTFYLESPAPIRSVIKDMIKELGLRDPRNYFVNELDSWPVERDDSKEALRGSCKHWLEGMMWELQEHRTHILSHQVPLERKYSFESCLKEQRSEVLDHVGQPARKANLETLKEEDLDDSTDLEEQPVAKDSFERFQKAKEAAPPWMRSVCAIDAVQSFIDKQLEKELMEMKRLVSSAALSPKDTVMALPPIQKRHAILRLGETNAMLRKRIPERFYFPYIFPRYLMKGFVPFMKLPLPKINLDPFPSPLERPASPKTFTAMQQVVQRYFIPKFSYADSYP
ncbi:WD repeat-containing protein 97 [Elgaria multicarinata webbii]|uniref:WD repeat-containing protein 97 n=1 Tax=Elgaria multicarinata webbii TaxID=159646 RepID=UPI002FCCC61F